MDHFPYRDGSLYAENVPVSDIASAHGTPCYIYSRAALESASSNTSSALADCEHLICYAVKANSNLAVLNVLARLGAGFDIVSGGELERVVAAGGDPAKVVFSGVGKKPEEMARALELGIHCFNLESAAELEVLNRVAAELGRWRRSRCGSTRMSTPGPTPTSPPACAKTSSASAWKRPCGLPARRGVEPYRGRGPGLPHRLAADRDQPVYRCPAPPAGTGRHPGRKGITIRHLDLGGGLGVRYRDEQPPSIADYIAAIRQELRDATCSYCSNPAAPSPPMPAYWSPGWSTSSRPRSTISPWWTPP